MRYKPAALAAIFDCDRLRLAITFTEPDVG
jgi:hypothetical protein